MLVVWVKMVALSGGGRNGGCACGGGVVSFNT